MQFIALIWLCLSLGVCPSLAADVRVGFGNQALICFPESFHYDNEDETTIFLMPRKDDPDGPISMRLTSRNDISKEKFSNDQVKRLLVKLNPGSEVLHFGENLATTCVREEIDENKINWHYVHYAVHADGLLVTVTIQAIKGREKEAQNKELLDEVPRILASIKKKSASAQ